MCLTKMAVATEDTVTSVLTTDFNAAALTTNNAPKMNGSRETQASESSG